MKNLKPQTSNSKKLPFVNNLLTKVCNWAVFTSFLLIILTVLFQISARYLLPRVPSWTEELSRYLFVFMVVFSAPSMILGNRHIKLDLLKSGKSAKWDILLKTSRQLIIFIFCILMVKYSWFYMEIGSRQNSPGLNLKMSWIYSSSLIFFILTGIGSFFLVINGVVAFRKQGDN